MVTDEKWKATVSPAAWSLCLRLHLPGLQLKRESAQVNVSFVPCMPSEKNSAMRKALAALSDHFQCCVNIDSGVTAAWVMRWCARSHPCT